MSSSKASPKRKRAIAIDDDDEYDEWSHQHATASSVDQVDDEYDSDLDKKPAAKRRKQDTSKQANAMSNDDSTGVDVFSIDLVATTIFSYLDTRELHQMSMTSKYVRECIQHKHIVRSALMRGGHVKQSMERLVPLIRDRKIWVPSAMRMLRLCNGKRCENCTFFKNSTSNNNNRVKMVSADFGVFFCWNGCIQDRFSREVLRNRKWSPFIDHDRVAAGVYKSKAYLFLRPYTDHSGEKAGPLITKEHVEPLATANSRRGRGSRSVRNKADDPYEAAINEILKACDEEERNSEFIEEIVHVFKQSTGDAAKRLEEKETKRKESLKKTIERKKQKAQELLTKLETALGDVPWKTCALAHREVDICKSNSPVVEFMSPIVDKILREFVISPSKINKTKLVKIKEQIEGAFSLIWKLNLHDFAFLSDSDEYQKILKGHLKETNSEPLFTHLHRLDSADLRFLKNQAQKEIEDPLVFLDFESWTSSYYGCLSIKPGLQAALVDNLQDFDHQCCHEQIVKHFWYYILCTVPGRTCDKGLPDDELSHRHYQLIYETCKARLPSFYENCFGFLSSKEAKELAGRIGTGDALSTEEAWKRAIVRGVLFGKAVQHIANQDYKRLLKLIVDERDVYFGG